MKKCKKCGSKDEVTTDNMNNNVCAFYRDIINEVEKNEEGDYIA